MAFDFASARREHGRLVVVDLEGHELVFRPLKPGEAHKVVSQTEAAPEDSLGIALETCRACCLSDLTVFDRLSDIYPLAFSGDAGVIGELINLARGDAVLRVKDGVGFWRRADRNTGRMAENLLAFKAYQGGDYTAEQFAGALTVAEWMQVTKGIFNMFAALLKALARRR
jgi:hypothetical protein